MVLILCLLILKALRSDSDGDYTCEQFTSLIVQAKSEGTVTKRLTYFFVFFFLLQISLRLSPLSTQKDSPCKKKLLIITSEIGNGIKINKGEMTVIMVVLMGSACIIKERIQRNNTDPLGCAAAPFWARWMFCTAAEIRITFNGIAMYVDLPRCWQRTACVVSFALK